MKSILSTIAILFAMQFESYGQITFQKTYGASTGLAYPGTNEISVMQTYDGNYCVAGTIDINQGDIYLMKLNPIGDTLWTKTYGGNFDDFLYSAEQTTDSGFILAGQTRSFSMGANDGYLIKTDKNGNIVWSKNYGGFSTEWFASIKQTNDNGFIACGATATFASGTLDVYLLKMDSVGHILWSKAIGGTDNDRGTFIEQTYDNGFIITGITRSFNAITERIYLIKTDSNGNVVWSKIFGGVMGEWGFCVKQCVDSGYIVTGYTNSFGAGAQDVFLLKTDTGGNLQWMKTYGGTWEDMAYYVEQTNDNGFVITGRTQSFGPGSGSARNVYLIKTNANGDTLWTKTYGSIINNGYCVKQTTDGGYIIASNPNTINVIKTDSFGNIGCNVFNTGTITNSVSPVILSGAFSGTGGAMNNAATITSYTPIVIDTLCISTSILYFSQDEEINIYPNPFKDKFNITLSEDRQLELILYDILGRNILQQKFISSLSLNTETLTKGIYIYEVRDKNGLCKKGKVVKD